MSEVFVSYKRDDVSVVERLVEALRREGLDVWWDRDLPPDAPWEQTIERELTDAKVVVVTWSEAAVGSENVKAEARWARRNGRLIQVYLQNCEPPLFFGERQGVNLVGWSGTASDPSFRLLVDAIQMRSTESHRAPRAATLTTQAKSQSSPRSMAAAKPDTSWIFPEGTLLNGLFEVRRFIARGLIGAVYEGVNVTTRERVAIKAFRPEFGDLPIVRDGLLHEMHLFARLTHPAIVPYRLAAREPAFGAIYIVTDFVDGVDLHALVGQVTLPEQQLRTLTCRLADGLKTAHELGVVHRGLDPGCIVAPNGRIDQSQITDFGISPDFFVSKISRKKEHVEASTRYAAPEQFGDFGGEVGPWTDVYSLGLVMSALSTGIAPPETRDAEERRVSQNLAHAPGGLRDLLARMTTPDPELRFRSMEGVLAALAGNVTDNRTDRPRTS